MSSAVSTSRRRPGALCGCVIGTQSGVGLSKQSHLLEATAVMIACTPTRRLREAVRVAAAANRRCCAACGGLAATWGALGSRTHVPIPSSSGGGAAPAAAPPSGGAGPGPVSAAIAGGNSGVFSPRGHSASSTTSSASGSCPSPSHPAPPAFQPVSLGWSADFETEVVRSGTQFPEGEKRYLDGPTGTICPKCVGVRVCCICLHRFSENSVKSRADALPRQASQFSAVLTPASPTFTRNSPSGHLVATWVFRAFRMEDFDAFREVLLMRQQQQLQQAAAAAAAAGGFGAAHALGPGGAGAGGFHEAFDYLAFGDADDEYEAFMARVGNAGSIERVCVVSGLTNPFLALRF